MHVLLVSSDFPPDPGGIAAHLYGLGTALVERGHVVSLIHQPRTPASQAHYSRYAALSGIDYWRLPATTGGALRPLLRALRVRRLVRQITSENHPDVASIVHFHDFMNTTLAAGLLRHRTAWTNHTSQFYQANKVQVVALKLALRQSKILCPSRELASLTTRRLGLDATYVPNGCNDGPPAHRPSSSSDPSREFTVFLPRRMVWKNGVDVAVDAFANIPPPTKHRQWRLVLPETGADPSYRRSVLRQLDALPAHVTVELLGEVGPDEMASIYARSDAVLIPSRIEAVSIAALEAASMAIPLVCTHVGGLHDAFAECPHMTLIPSEDPSAIVEAISSIECQPLSVRQHVGAELATWTLERYHWSEIAKATVRVYESGA